LSKEWVDQSFTPWIKSSPRAAAPNYGWYWWTSDYAPHWRAHVASGWKGQRICVIPEKKLVVTMTGIVEQNEDALCEEIVRDYVVPAVDGLPGQSVLPDASLRQPLAALLEQVRQGPLRGQPGVESHMIPSIEHKEGHLPLSPLYRPGRASARA